MRRPLVVLLTVLGLGCLTGAVQAFGIVSVVPFVGDGSDGRAVAAARPDGVAVRDGRVAVNTTADRPDVDAGDGRCAGPRGFCTLRAAVMEANANDELVRVTLQRRAYRLRARGSGEDRGRRGDLDVSGSVTIVGCGARILGGKIDRVFDVADSARLEIVGARIAGGAPPEGESGGAIRTAGRLTLTRVRVVKNVVTGSGAGGGVFNDGGTVLLRASQINRNETAGAGGAIAADGGTTLLRDSRLLVNRAGSGGGLYLTSAGTGDVRDTSVERNHAAARGGGVHVEGSNLRIDGGSVSDNGADDSSSAGGAVFNDRGTVVVDGADMRRNRAGGDGGGVAAIAGTTTLAHVQAWENRARAGGAVHLTGGGGRLAIDSSVLQANHAASSGGALWADSGTVAITGTTYLVVNSAAGAGAQEGGGAIFNDGARIEIDGGPVAGNRATGAAAAGGAILNRAGTLLVRDGDVSRNAAGRAGGGIAIGGGSVQAEDCAIDGNTAARGGAVHVGGPGSFASHRGRISGNRAGEQGGGLWNTANGTIRLTRTNVIGNDAPARPQMHNAGPPAAFTFDGEPAGA